MLSTNFEFLRSDYPELANLAAFSEAYAYSDPASSRVKSRILAENVALRLCQLLKLPIYDGDNFLTLIKSLSDSNVVPKAVINTFHQLRLAGNVAAHQIKNDASHAVETVRSVFMLTRWWLKFVSPDAILPEIFIPLSKKAGTDLSGEERELNERLKEINKELAEENERLRERNKQLSAKEKESISARGKSAADALKFDEKTTRKRLIDQMILAAGWDITDSDQVGQEVILEDKDFSGRADYALYDDDGTALAVIEAKKTSIDPQTGKIQGKLYADVLESKDPDHIRPLIILSNGYETLLVDDSGGPATLPVKGYVDRKIYGIPSKDSLQYRARYQRRKMLDPATLAHNEKIAGDKDHLYQLEAIKAVAERFGEQRGRKALIVQATGTGKTRVAVALADLLMRANFVKRVLFLCDRKELRKQAKGAFNRFMPDKNVKNLDGKNDQNAEVLIATYPGMMRRFQEFDIGHFDLIIADESHRSIYNKYRDLFLYFDSLQLGLTATPVKQIDRNTYRMFECEDQNPTYYYEYERAVREGTVVDFKPIEVTTRFMREGIHYNQLSEEEKRELEEDGIDWEDLDVDASELDSTTYNKDTNRKILENLMLNGLRDHTDNGPGKSIIFARNHKHAMLLRELFQEMYPEYGSGYCEVIDNKIRHAEQLIDDFKNIKKNPVIAISVDMLDTGIDVPEILNLVFAKPVKSYVKFWQMIGRGTRLCPDLHGPGQDKKLFYLFDHWGNCEYFSVNREMEKASPQISNMERLFEQRLVLAETFLNNYDKEGFAKAIGLLRETINALPEDSLPVKEKIKSLLYVKSENVLENFSADTVKLLRKDIKPLTRFIYVEGGASGDALKFDLLMTRLQIEALKESAGLADLRSKLDNELASLAANINAVRDKFTEIKELRDPGFWEKSANELVPALEDKRLALRGIMGYKGAVSPSPFETRVLDLADSGVQTTVREPLRPYAGDMAAYKKRVHEVLEPHFKSDPVLVKLRRGEAITEKDFEKLASLVLTRNEGVDLETLREFYPATEALIKELRAIVGLDGEAIKERFAAFYQKYPTLDLTQTQFLNLLQRRLAQNGPIKIAELYENPFTALDSQGPEGIFTEPVQKDELFAIVRSFNAEPATWQTSQ